MNLHQNLRIIVTVLVLVIVSKYGICQSGDRIVHPNRAPKTIELLQDQYTALMSYRGKLEGTITHNPIENPALRDRDNRIVYGFTSSKDKIIWTVNAPEAADYQVAVQYTGKMYNSVAAQELQKKSQFGPQRWDPQCVVEIESNNKVLSAELSRVTKYNEPNKVAGVRQWLNGRLPLKRGVNQISLHFSKLSDQQVKAAKKELKEGTLFKSTLSLGIKSIELVRPSILQKMKKIAQELKSNTQWMVDGKYGLFIHWSLLTYPLYGDQQAHETFEWGVNTFDVEAFAEMVEETGASWVTFTTCHGRQMFPAPIKTLDKLLPGRTTKRDLISALAGALNRRNIKLLLYYNFSGGDTEFAEVVGMNDENPQKWFQYLNDFSSEISERYGKKIAGWGYIDSSVPAYELNMPWEAYFRALKAGNPAGIVAISSHWWAEFSPYNDLQTTDSGGSLIDPLNPNLYMTGGRYEGLQQHFSFVIDGSWIPREPYNGIIRANSKSEGGPRYPSEDYINYFQKMDRANVPITANILITQDVTRNQPFVNAKTLELMRQIRKAVWGK
jgi:hypothetical protein